MSREAFLEQLKYLLSDLSEEEQEEALAYYQDYFEEAGEAHEQEAITHFGSPERVAAEIRAGLAGSLGEGEFTEHGYRDKRFEESPNAPDHYAEIVKADGSARQSEDREEYRENFGEAGKGWKEKAGQAWEQARHSEFGRKAGRAWSDARESEWGKKAGRAWSDARSSEWGRKAGRAWSDAKEGEWGRKTERAWSDAKDRERSRREQDRYDGDEMREEIMRRDRRRGKVLFLLLFLFFGLPLGGSIIGAGFSVIAAIFGGVLGIFGGLFGLAMGGLAGAIGMFSAGIGLIVTGACNMASPAIGLMLIGFGFFAIAVGVLCLWMVRWGFCVAVPCVFQVSVSVVRTICGWLVGLLRRLFGGGRRE